jgi:NAD(P)-dependent dehydrogenase (short-subunit alcohol dehydrogenase family)
VDPGRGTRHLRGAGAYVRHIPLQRLGDPEEAARTIGWLCSDDGSYITAAAVAIDGGMMFAWPTEEREAPHRK